MADAQSDAVHLYDSWVKGKKGLLHFDVMTTGEATALKLAIRYWDSLGEHDVTVTLKECQFCRSEPLVLLLPNSRSSSANTAGSFSRCPLSVATMWEERPQEPERANLSVPMRNG